MSQENIESRENKLGEFRELAKRYGESLRIVDPGVIVYQMQLVEKLKTMMAELGLTEEDVMKIQEELNAEAKAKLEEK